MNHDYKNTSREQEARTRELALWSNTVAGRYLQELEYFQISQLLPDLFGYHIIQVGDVFNKKLLDSSRINHKLVSSAFPDPETGKNPDLICSNTHLPVMSESVDVVVLPHVLEFELQPHQLLRETERVLIGEGHVIITGFNPPSLWGLWRLFLKWRQKPPWNSNAISLTRMKDWLALLDFEIVYVDRFFFRPPSNNERLMNKLAFLEQLGHYCWPYFGNAYILLAKKRVVPMTPVKLQWQSRRRLIATGMIEPSS